MFDARGIWLLSAQRALLDDTEKVPVRLLSHFWYVVYAHDASVGQRVYIGVH
jgi:hypothetical protein